MVGSELKRWTTANLAKGRGGEETGTEIGAAVWKIILPPPIRCTTLCCYRPLSTPPPPYTPCAPPPTHTPCRGLQAPVQAQEADPVGQQHVALHQVQHALHLSAQSGGGQCEQQNMSNNTQARPALQLSAQGRGTVWRSSLAAAHPLPGPACLLLT